MKNNNISAPNNDPHKKLMPYLSSTAKTDVVNKNNLCSIFHSRFKNLTTVIPSTNKARLMDYILLGWRTSKYKLKNSDQKWFMKHYDEIIDDTGIKRSTLGRYIKELADEGLIVRRRARYSRTNEDGEFVVKTGTYIHPTDELLNSLKPIENNQPKQENIHNELKEHSEDNYAIMENSNTDSSVIDNNERTGSLKMRELYIRDLYPSLNNNIKYKKLKLSVNKPSFNRLVKQYESIEKLFNTEIKEEISEEVNKLVLGTFFNLTFQDKKQLSSPMQIAAEFLFELINVEFYMPHITCFKHRNNILAKLIRTNNWRTPKGFFNHFYLGQKFKDKLIIREKQWQESKENEAKGKDFKRLLENRDERLVEVEKQMEKKSNLLDALMHQLRLEASEEIILQIRERIQIVRSELENLWAQQSAIERTLGKEQWLNEIRLCA